MKYFCTKYHLELKFEIAIHLIPWINIIDKKWKITLVSWIIKFKSFLNKCKNITSKLVYTALHSKSMMVILTLNVDI